MKKKELNPKLRQTQDAIRQNTVKTIEAKIKSLQSEGYIVTVSMLMDQTGFSRSLFQKSHVKDLLRKYRIGKFRSRTVLPIGAFSLQIADKEITKLSQELSRWKARCEDQQTRIETLMQRLEGARVECEILRGEIISVHNKARQRGITLT